MSEIRNISLPTSRTLKKMTTVIGIKCIDGIVIASDSQASSETIKDLQTSKIFPINNSIMVGAAGNMGHIRTLTDELKRGLDGYMFDTDSQLTNHLDNMVVNLHRVYNLQRSARLGYSPPIINLNANGMLAAKLSDGTFGLYSLAISEPWVYPIDNYDAIGSGYLFANLVLRQQSRVPKSKGKTLSQLELIYNIWIAIYAINEVKQIEPYTGGSTKVAFLNKDGLKLIPDNEVSKFYIETIDKTSESLANRPETSDLGELLKHAYPQG